MMPTSLHRRAARATGRLRVDADAARSCPAWVDQALAHA